MLFLSLAEIVTDQQYCSRTARHALYTIAAQLRANNREEWNAEWDVASLTRRGHLGFAEILLGDHGAPPRGPLGSGIVNRVFVWYLTLISRG